MGAILTFELFPTERARNLHTFLLRGSWDVAGSDASGGELTFVLPLRQAGH